MTSSTSSSDAGGRPHPLRLLPWAGLLALALLLLLDRGLLGHDGPWQLFVVEDPNSAAGTRVALKQLREAPQGRPRVAVVGTSRVIDGFDVALAERLLPGVAFAKLGHPRFEPFALRALVGDLLDARVDAVCLIASEQDTHRPLRLEPVPGSSAASLGALLDLLRAGVRAGGWPFVRDNRTELYRLVATSALLAYRYRPDLRLALARDVEVFELDRRIPSTRPREEPFRPVALWGATRHRVEPAARRSTFDLFPPRMDQWDARIQAGTVQEITAGSHVAVQMYLYRRMLEELRTAGVEVVILQGAMHPAADDLYDTSLRLEFEAFAQELVRDLGVHFVPRAGMPLLAESDFYDLVHTNRRGAGKLTRAMLRGLRATAIDWPG
jgi:hypothetical protein